MVQILQVGLFYLNLLAFIYANEAADVNNVRLALLAASNSFEYSYNIIIIHHSQV